MSYMNGKELFTLLGDLDEELVEDAWAEHDDEVIILEDRSPMRFVKAAAAVAAGIAVLAGGFYGYTKLRHSAGYSPAASGYSEESAAESSEPEAESSEPAAESGSESSDPEIIAPAPIIDEPTIFVGLDGQRIMSSEVMQVEGTDKAPAEITLDDAYAEVYCDGFQYFREPLGVAYNNIQDPELFDGKKFIGDMPENTNKWKRINVGDEICGLKLTRATTQFQVCKPMDFNKPEAEALGYEINTNTNRVLPYFVEFEGTVDIEGFLCVTAPNLFNDGGELKFYPTEDVLPILGGVGVSKYGDDYIIRSAHETEALRLVNEMPFVEIYESKVGYNEIEGIGLGDAVLARVSLTNIRYAAPGYEVFADVAAVNVLTEPLAHVDEWMQK